jgi:hypothetical protein
LDNLTIYGYPDSAAQKYAQENDITFVSLDSEEHTHIFVLADDLDWIDDNEASCSFECFLCDETEYLTLTFSDTEFVYNGATQVPEVYGEWEDGTELTDYQIYYDDDECKDAGDYVMYIVLGGTTQGIIEADFFIDQAQQKIQVADKTKTEGDKAFALGAKLTFGDGKLTYKSSNQKVATVSANGKVTIKGAGKAKITVTAAQTDNFLKTVKSVTITVNPKATTLSALKNKAAGKLQITWKSNKAVTGYEVQYSTSAKFVGAKTVKIGKSKTVSTTVSKLKKGKKYYVRIRTYKTVSGKKYYSAWSKAKNLKITK